MKKCIACGMPMTKTTDFPKGDETKNYCVHCANEDGSMQTFEQRKQGMIEFVIRAQGYDRSAAEKMVTNNMRQLPAWKNYFDRSDS